MILHAVQKKEKKKQAVNQRGRLLHQGGSDRQMEIEVSGCIFSFSHLHYDPVQIQQTLAGTPVQPRAVLFYWPFPFNY